MLFFVGLTIHRKSYQKAYNLYVLYDINNLDWGIKYDAASMHRYIDKPFFIDNFRYYRSSHLRIFTEKS